LPKIYNIVTLVSVESAILTYNDIVNDKHTLIKTQLKFIEKNLRLPNTSI